jgi:3-oxoacyl-[acyl-carrier protein] reductase
MNLAGKVVLVTGSSRGIGRATALHMGRLGAKVAVTYNKSEDAAQKVVTQLLESGVEAFAYQVDVAEKNSVRRMVENVMEEFGRIDVLVNNAGTIHRPGDWDKMDDSQVDRTLAVNLKGPLHCIQTVAPLMLKQRFGRIINITSTYAILGAAGIAAYAAAKAGVISLTKSFAREFAPYITVNAVAPGNVDTQMTREAGNEVNNWAIRTTPLQRLARPEEIAEAISYLACADFVTAHVLVIDGGQMSQIL